MNVLKLPRSIVNTVLTQAQHSPDAEICGLIGANNESYNCYPINNTAADPKHRYLMEPSGQIDAMRQMREAGEELLAIYHSHPDAPAFPSATDIAEAEYPETAYLIISLDTEGVLQMSAFRITAGEASAIELELA